eukprot:SAG22_NODE_328_length_12271_cov_9.681811_9_plen_260_part_00
MVGLGGDDILSFSGAAHAATGVGGGGTGRHRQVGRRARRPNLQSYSLRLGTAPGTTDVPPQGGGGAGCDGGAPHRTRSGYRAAPSGGPGYCTPLALPVDRQPGEPAQRRTRRAASRRSGKYEDFIKSSIQSHLDALVLEDGTTELKDIQKCLLYHQGRVNEVVAELPAKMQLGIFDINTRQVRDFMSAKHAECVAALQNLVATQVRDKCNEICTEIDQMASNVRKPARSPEHAQEHRQYFIEVEGKVKGLRPMIAELPA